MMNQGNSSATVESQTIESQTIRSKTHDCVVKATEIVELAEDINGRIFGAFSTENAIDIKESKESICVESDINNLTSLLLKIGRLLDGIGSRLG